MLMGMMLQLPHKEGSDRKRERGDPSKSATEVSVTRNFELNQFNIRSGGADTGQGGKGGACSGKVGDCGGVVSPGFPPPHNLLDEHDAEVVWLTLQSLLEIGFS